MARRSADSAAAEMASNGRRAIVAQGSLLMDQACLGSLHHANLPLERIGISARILQMGPMATGPQSRRRGSCR